MPLASFMKLAKSTPLELRQTSFHGGEPRNPDWRSVGKVQTTGMYLGDSYLDLPKASLTEIEWDDEKGVGKLKCYDAGFRDYNEEEKAALAEWKKITDTDEYRDMALRDAYTDTSSTYWKEKSFWEDKGMEYMFHTKKGGKLRTQNPDKKDDRGFSVDEIRDDSIKGRLWGEYEIRRKEGQDNSLENIITNAIIEALNGGKGSGNFGHSGRPGEVGGSAPSGSSSSSVQDDIAKSRALTKKVFKDLGYDDPAKLTEKDWKKLYKEVDKRAEKELKEEIKVKSKEYDQLFDKLLDASKDTNNKNVSAIKKLIRQFDDNTKIWNLEPEDQPAEYDRRVKEIKKILAESKKPKSEGLSLRGKSLYEKVHMIEPGDEVHIKPSSKVPNFPKEIKVDYVEDGTIHYGSSETSDGYTYPAWAIDDIKKIIRKK